jgi:hypothetical protein
MPPTEAQWAVASENTAANFIWLFIGRRKRYTLAIGRPLGLVRLVAWFYAVRDFSHRVAAVWLVLD